MYLYSGLQISRLRGPEETLQYFGNPPISEFSASVGEKLSQTLYESYLRADVGGSDTITFTALPPTSANPANGRVLVQGFLSQGWAILLRKDAPQQPVGSGLPGVFTNNPAVIEGATGASGDFAIVKPFSPPVTPTRASAAPEPLLPFWANILLLTGLAVAATNLLAPKPRDADLRECKLR